jgi:hypothetical protein
MGKAPLHQNVQKASIFLTADQLEQHAQECIALAAVIRTRLRGLDF